MGCAIRGWRKRPFIRRFQSCLTPLLTGSLVESAPFKGSDTQSVSPSLTYDAIRCAFVSLRLLALLCMVLVQGNLEHHGCSKLIQRSVKVVSTILSNYCHGTSNLYLWGLACRRFKSATCKGTAVVRCCGVGEAVRGSSEDIASLRISLRPK